MANQRAASSQANQRGSEESTNQDTERSSNQLSIPKTESDDSTNRNTENKDLVAKHTTGSIDTKMETDTKDDNPAIKHGLETPFETKPKQEDSDKPCRASEIVHKSVDSEQNPVSSPSQSRSRSKSPDENKNVDQ